MATIAKLPIGHTETLTAVYKATESDMGRDDVTCTATARSGRTEVKGTSAAIVMEAVRRALKLTKTVANTPDDGEAYAPGEDVEFDIKTENTGNQTLSGVEVTEQTEGVSIVEGDGYTLEGGTAKIATLPPKQFVTVDSVKHVDANDYDKHQSWTNTAQGKIDEIIQSSVSPVVYFKNPVPQDLSSLSWDSDIPEVAENAAKDSEKYSQLIGMEKTFATSGLGTFAAVCVDVAHFEKQDGSGKAGFVFQFKEATSTDYPMNPTNTNTGGYPASPMYTTTLPNTILAAMQDEVKNAIVEVKFPYNVYKGSGHGDSAFTIAETHAKLFLPSNREVWGTTPLDSNGSDAGEYLHTGDDGTQFAYWVQHPTIAEHIKKKVGTETAAHWWCRSCGPNAADFIFVYTTGSVDYSNANYTNIAVAPCFCI